MTVHLLGGPWITVGEDAHEVPEGSKRLLALLALDRRALDRRHVAGMLWPETDEVRAAGCLRTSLWRLQRTGHGLIAVTPAAIRLDPGLRVDTDHVTAWADRVLDRGADSLPAGVDLHRPALVSPALHLLPGWFEDWVLVHRDRLRQRVLHALDAVAGALCELGDFSEAVDAALAAVHADPLRESAQRALIRAHLAEGNLVEARRVFDRFHVLLRQELQAIPGPDLFEAVGLSRPR